MTRRLYERPDVDEDLDAGDDLADIADQAHPTYVPVRDDDPDLPKLCQVCGEATNRPIADGEAWVCPACLIEQQGGGL